MAPPEPMRMSAVEFVAWAGGNVSGLIRPDVCVAVDRRYPGETFSPILKRVGWELRQGATRVVLLSEVDQAACVYSDDALPKLHAVGTELTIPDILPGFSVPVRSLFEKVAYGRRSSGTYGTSCLPT